MDINTVIDKARSNIGARTDNDLAKRLKTTKTRIGNYRTRTSAPNLEMCLILAKLANANPIEVIIESRIEAARTEKELQTWTKFKEDFL